VEDVARVVATLLENPQPHIGKIYHLTGPQSENMHFYAQEYSKALGRTITFQDIRSSRGATRCSIAACRFTCEPPRDNGRSGTARTVRPNVRRRVHVSGATAAKRPGVRQEKCGDIHRIGKSTA